jgi:hypothetical protein
MDYFKQNKKCNINIFVMLIAAITFFFPSCSNESNDDLKHSDLTSKEKEKLSELINDYDLVETEKKGANSKRFNSIEELESYLKKRHDKIEETCENLSIQIDTLEMGSSRLKGATTEWVSGATYKIICTTDIEGYDGDTNMQSRVTYYSTLGKISKAKLEMTPYGDTPNEYSMGNIDYTYNADGSLNIHVTTSQTNTFSLGFIDLNSTTITNWDININSQRVITKHTTKK